MQEHEIILISDNYKGAFILFFLVFSWSWNILDILQMVLSIWSLIHEKYVSTFPDFLWLSLRCFYLVLQPEVLSYATAQPIKILGVPSLLPKLQQTQTETHCTVSFFQQPENRSEGKHSTVTAGRHGTRELQMQKTVERHTQIHTVFYLELWQLVKTVQERKKLKKNLAKNVQGSEKTVRSCICLCIHLL